MIPQYRPLIDRVSLAKEVGDYILSDGYFTEYKKTEEFEAAIAKAVGAQYCSVVNNGTISLSLALLASGLKPGDRVIIPNITMIATCNAVKLLGMIPVLVDVDHNLCLDLAATKATILTGSIKAIIYVTLNGRSHTSEEMVDLDRFCESNRVTIIEDNAQSLGSYRGLTTAISCPPRGIGSFSFSMPKIITTGQGGCLVTNVESLANKIRKLKDFGRTAAGIDIHDEFGINSKFTEIQAIIGLNQLTTLNQRIVRKREIYNRYLSSLHSNDEIAFISHHADTTPWFIDIYTTRRDELQAYLKALKIGTRAIYPPLSSQQCNRDLRASRMPVSERYASFGLWLPSSLDLTNDEIDFVCGNIRNFYGQ